jgi:hypothetical protein
MSARAKFRVHSVESNRVAMHPVYADSDENKRFFRATPGGEISMFATNPDVVGEFEVGDEFYVDFTKAPKPEA